MLRNTEPQVVEVDVMHAEQTQTEDHPALALPGEDLDSGQQDQLAALLRKWSHVFAAHEDDFGKTAVVTH